MIEKSLDCLEQTVGRKRDVKGNSAEGSHRNEEGVLRKWRKSDPCFKSGRKPISGEFGC